VPVIETHGLSKRYGRKDAVVALDLRVEAGAIYGLLGANGAGKTTTFSMLLGYTRPTAGQGTVLGVPLDRPELRKGLVGALPQDASLSPDARLETLLAYYGRLGGLSAAAAREDTARVLELFELSDRARSKVRTLSHGMRKRAALAQAFLGDPKLVLLDEPTTGLDPRLARDMREHVKAQRGGRTIVVSSHNLSEIEEMCDEVAILKQGKLVHQGSVAALRAGGHQVVFAVEAAVPDATIAALTAAGFTATWSGEQRRLVVAAQDDAAVDRVMRDGTRILVDGGVRLWSVTRGRTLEESFLAMT
jgi:ABC-type multidrug transport system ATPase subunit